MTILLDVVRCRVLLNISKHDALTNAIKHRHTVMRLAFNIIGLCPTNSFVPFVDCDVVMVSTHPGFDILLSVSYRSYCGKCVPLVQFGHLYPISYRKPIIHVPRSRFIPSNYRAM